jgi:PAP2 superfamily
MIAQPCHRLVGAAAKTGPAPRSVQWLAPTRLTHWLSVRHSLAGEAVAVLVLYATYEAARGLVVGDRRVAVDHAQTVATFERRLHLFIEPNVQHAAHALPGLLTLLGDAYLTLHLSVTAALLLWLHQRRPAVFARTRTTLLLASALALIGFVAFQTAPPRLADLGIADTVSGGHVDLNKGLVSALYNPYAAVPSMHVGYALIVAGALFRHGGARTVRFAAAAYPLLVLLVVVATGNHFLFDAAAGALVALLAYSMAATISKAGKREILERPRPAAPGHGLPQVATANVRDLQPLEEELAA